MFKFTSFKLPSIFNSYFTHTIVPFIIMLPAAPYLILLCYVNYVSALAHFLTVIIVCCGD